jgi:organic radical activating enzyme
MSEVASGRKVAYHVEKLMSYLQGRPIFPATLEMDITSRCTRICKDCPSSRSSESDNLPLDFVRDLFALFEGQTRGLLMTGGEPTSSPDFPAVLHMARRFGFEDIAVVTNGSLLGTESVAEALIEHASTIRLSMYDWESGGCGIETTLQDIERLRGKIDSAKSPLQIGISMLTSSRVVDRLAPMSEEVRNAGAHWIYFHPVCTGWNSGCPQQVDQKGVLETVTSYRDCLKDGFQAFISADRYRHDSLHFSAYHAAHFLMILGADKKNYLGAEVKYQPQHVLAELPDPLTPTFLWQEERLKRISEADSARYPALGSRHRGVLYSHFIESLKRTPPAQLAVTMQAAIQDHRFPHIL